MFNMCPDIVTTNEKDHVFKRTVSREQIGLKVHGTVCWNLLALFHVRLMFTRLLPLYFIRLCWLTALS
jgi:hypothetical protein